MNQNLSTNTNIELSSNQKKISPGFSENAFGGFQRLDNIDLRQYRSSERSPEGVLFLHTIMDAAHNYLFYGLCPNNGTCAEEFYYAYEYFFKVHSGDLKKYEECKEIRKVYHDGTKKLTEVITITKESYDLMCFDMHIKYSGINCTPEKFTDNLKRKRKMILKHNWTQVNKYFNDLNAEGNQYRLCFVDRFKVLTEPESPEELELLFK